MRARVSAALLAVAVTAAAQVPHTVRLTFAGDIMAHDVNYLMADYGDIYRGVKDIFTADDLSIANLELPVDPTRPAAGYPLFNGTLAYVRAAVDAGIDLFSTANNHAFDGGAEGIFQTLRVLERLRTSRPGGVFSGGTRGNEHSLFIPVSLWRNGVHIGFLALSQFLNERDAGRYVHVVDYADEDAVEDLLRSVREQSRRFDLFIVSYHGDREYVQTPSPLKRRFFHRLLEAGATIVYGHHPHVVQGYEILRVGGTDRLAMYSMGNLISGMTWTLNPALVSNPLNATGEAYLLSVSVVCVAGSCTVQDALPIPIADYRNARGEMVVGRMSELAAGAAGLSPPWTAYYAARLSLMERFLGATPALAASATR
jgi:poly-gamma-glutamate capsule biosynthesis protein CapA/YwtB (metallophosphatase superfamily)